MSKNLNVTHFRLRMLDTLNIIDIRFFFVKQQTRKRYLSFNFIKLNFDFHIRI